MFATSRLASLGWVATLALALTPLAGAAYADDEYGTGHAAVIAQAASSQPTAPLSADQVAKLNDVFKVGQNDAFGDARDLPRGAAADGGHKPSLLHRAGSAVRIPVAR